MDPRLLRRSRATRGAIAVLVLIGTLQAGAIIAQAWLLATVVADLVGGGSLADHGRDLLLLGATFGVRGLLAAAQQRTAHRASAAVKSALREELLQARLARPFDADTSGGALLDLATRGVEALDGWFAGYLPQLVLAVLVPSVVGLAIGLADPTSLLVVVLTMPLIPVFMVLVGLVTRDRLDARWRAGARLAHHFADLVSGLGTLQVFGRARAQVAGLRRIEQRHEQATLQTLRVAFLSALVLELLATLSVALVAVGIGLRVVEGDLTLFVGLLVLVLAPEVYLPLRQVGARYHDAADGMAAAEQAFTLIDATAPARAGQSDRARTDDRADQPGQASATGIGDHRGTGSQAQPHGGGDVGGDRVPPRLGAITAGEVRVEGLRLVRDGRVVVSDLSFRIAPGEVVAVAGPSGAGKSSLLVALLGHLRPSAGCIRVDRTPLDQIEPECWRRHVAWVGQQPDLWPATVAANVLLGAPGAPRSAVRAVLDRAGAATVELDQVVAPDGTGLSAGEQRRVALARALLAIDVGGARMLVLDEPTAGLDVDTEATVIASLRAAGVSVLVVSHRAPVLAAADHVVHLPRLGPRPSSAVMVSPHDVGGRPIDRTRRPDPSVAGRGDTGSAALPDTRTTGLTVRAGALAIGAAAAGVGLMATAAWLLARASEQPPVLYLLVAVTLVRFFGLSRGVLRYLDRLASHRLGLRHQAAARIASYAGLAGSAVVGRPLGELVARLVLDTEAAQDRVVRVRLPVVAAWTLGIVVSLGAGLLVPAAGALLAAYLVLLGLVWPALAASVSARSDDRLAALRGELAEQVLLVHRHAVLLHTTGRQQAGLAELRRVDAALRHAERRAATSRGLGQLAGWVTLGVLLPALLVVGGRAVTAGELAPILLAVLALTPLALQELLLPLVDSFGLRRPTRAALARVAELASTAPAVGAVPRSLPGPRLRLESLVVGRERPLLAPVSLDVGPGERVVLVGPSGVGKSTLVATLLGQLAPHAGTVSVGGRLGCLTQDAHLFDTTVAENLRIGRPEASDADVEQALAAVGLDLDPARMIGEHGSEISGGEARRVALARVLLAEPATVMIDEPTEHLDADTARALLCDVDAIWSRAPVVAVSHQPEVFLEAWGTSVTVVPVYPVGSSMMSVGTL